MPKRMNHFVGSGTCSTGSVHHIFFLVLNLNRHFEFTGFTDKFHTIFGQFEVSVGVDIFLNHAHEQSLTEDSVQGTLFLIACGAEVLQFIVVVTHHFCCLVAVKDVHDMFGLVVFVNLLNGLERQLQQLAGIHLFVGLSAVIAVTAFLFVVFFSEIVEQQFATADSALGIALRLEEQLIADAYLFGRFVFLEPAKTLYVIGAVEAYTLSFASVTSCTSGLSIPIPKAMVATITCTSSMRKASWLAERVAASIPAW